jgi:hypothetical protein
VEVNGSGQHSSLLQCGNNYVCKKLIVQAPRAIIKPFSSPQHNKLERLSLALFQADERGYKANQTIPMLGRKKGFVV